MDTLTELPVFIKNYDDFSMEQEFRVTQYASSGYGFEGEEQCLEYDEVIPKGIKYRIREDNLIPYIEFKLPKTALVGVILGSEIETKENLYALQMILESRGYSAGIFKSRIQI